MRLVTNKQMYLGQTGIENIEIDVTSRDDIPRILLGLQHIYCNEATRAELFSILAELVPVRKDGNKASSTCGRPGMRQWEMLVLGTLRLCLDADYDRLVELANQHHVVRKMLGCNDGFGSTNAYKLQTVRDNVRLFTPEYMDRINQVVVHSGHALLGHGADDKISGRCDSFVLKTDVSFPTDIGLLFTAIRKVIELCRHLYDDAGAGDWRQSTYNIRRFKRQYRIIQKMKHSTSRNEARQQEIAEKIIMEHNTYLDMAQSFLTRAEDTIKAYMACEHGSLLAQLEIDLLRGYMRDTTLLMDQIVRRVVTDEKIPHQEKIFSLFQRHTEWISKGKAGVPVELGLRVCIMEDHDQFILHHQVMEKVTDDKVTLSMVNETRERFPELSIVSMDKGFHSKTNQKDLKEILEQVVMPKKGRLSQADKERESDPAFVRLRLNRSAVESAINSLQVHGLSICQDHGIAGFKRYAAMAVLAHNIHRIGAILREKELKRIKRCKKAA
jgi:hypothetical protein